MNPSVLYWNARSALAWLLAVVAIIYFGATNPDFLNQGNIYALLQQYSTLLLVTIGLAVVMICGEFDLSVAGTFPLAGLIAVQSTSALGAVGGVLLAVLVGVAIGAINGWLTGTLRISSLAVTVATMVLAIGVGFMITNGKLVSMTDYDASLFLARRLGGVFSALSLMQIALAVAVYFYLRYGWRGRLLYATGSDAGRARASGLPVTATVLFAFTACAALTAFGGALQGISLASAQAGSNDAFLLQCATAALLGGIALTGGRGSLVGVFGAVLLLVAVSNGLSLAGIDAAIIQLVNGVILVVVVLIDTPLNREIDRRLGELSAAATRSDPVRSDVSAATSGGTT